MNRRDLTAKNIKVKTGSIADWYKSFTERVKSISKKLEDDYEPWDDLCERCKKRDHCTCCYECGVDGYNEVCRCHEIFQMYPYLF